MTMAQVSNSYVISIADHGSGSGVEQLGGPL